MDPESFGDNFKRYQSLCEGNASESNTTSDLWLVEDKTSGQVTAAFLLLFLVIGLPWNLLVIVTIVKQRLYTQPTIVLLLNLVVTDLILIVFVMPFIILTGFQGKYIFGDTDHVRCISCKIGFVSHAFSLVSVFNISLMSCDRFLFIYKPLKYEIYITSRRTLVVVAATWVFIILVSILPLCGVNFGHVIFYPPLTSCVFDMSVNHGFYPVLVFIVSFLPIPALVLSNACVCRIVQKNIKAIYGTTNSQQQKADEIHKIMKKKRQQKQLHLIQVFGCLLCSNVIMWLPIVILCFLSILPVDKIVIPPAVTATAHIFFMLQVVLHPLVETAILKDVRQPLKRTLFSCCVRTKASMKTEDERNCKCSWCQSNDQGCSPGYCGFVTVCSAALLMRYPDSRFSRSLSSFISRQNASAASVISKQSSVV